jgi:hypothetical protein
MFIIGTGRIDGAAAAFRSYRPARCTYSGFPAASAFARASAIETPSSALAPRRPLLGVPSSAIICVSIARWSASLPLSAAAISPFTLATAFVTPLPW